MPRYFLSDKFYDEIYFSSFEECNIIGETLLMHTKQNTPGSIFISGISDLTYLHWTTPIFYPNSTGQANLNISISHSSVDSAFEIKVIAFTVNTECNCTNQVGADGPVDYDPENPEYISGFDFGSVTAQTLDTINVFEINDLIVDCCDNVIGICVEYRWTAGRGFGDITINTDVDDSYVDSDLAHNECKPYNLRNPFQHNFVRQNDRVIEGFLEFEEYSIFGSSTSRSRIFSIDTNENDVINGSTFVMILASEWIVNLALPAGGANIIDYTNLFSTFELGQVFVKRITIKNQAGTETAIYNVSYVTDVLINNIPYWEIGVSHVSGSISNPDSGQALKVELIF